MNYRHAYHAGNFADVLKHIVLCRTLIYMTRKSQPLRVIDLYAGCASYDLAGAQADKTGEWRDGIGRLMAAELPPAAAALVAPYVNAVLACNEGAELRHYPGSPLIARAMMRRCDTLIANELHPEDAAILKQTLLNSPATRVMTLDAATAIKSLLPPPERRGVILIDPPFEARDEFVRLIEMLKDATRRFATGTYLVWYPVKDAHEVSRFLRDVRALGLAKLLNVTMAVAARGTRTGLAETGMLVVNPPYVLGEELAAAMPELTKLMERGQGSGFTLENWSNTA